MAPVALPSPQAFLKYTGEQGTGEKRKSWRQARSARGG